MLRSLRLALAFFTVLPVGGEVRHEPGDLARASGWLPVVGLVVGAAVATAGLLTEPLPAGLGAAIALAVWLAVTGMLHFDGLLDCADALLAPAPAQRRLEILKDVHAGAFAVGVGGLALLLKWQALAASEAGVQWVVVAVAARVSAVIALERWPQARSTGLGAEASGLALWPSAVCIVGAFAVNPLAAVATVVVGLVATATYARRLDGRITGDVLGAVIETAELGGLIAIAAAQGVSP